MTLDAHLHAGCARMCGLVRLSESHYEGGDSLNCSPYRSDYWLKPNDLRTEEDMTLLTTVLQLHW